MYSFQEFSKLLGVNLDDCLFLILLSLELKQVNIIKSARVIKLNRVNNRN